MATSCLHSFALLRRFLLPAVVLLGVAQAHAGLVLHYAFDETSGATAADSSGSGNTGTLFNGGSTPWVPGRIGNALSIDYVTNGYVRAVGYEGVLGTNARTLAYWVNSTNLGEYNYAVTWGVSGGTLSRIEAWNHGSNGKALLSFGGANIGGSGPSVTDGTWHHVAYSFPDSASLADVKIYVDGTLYTTAWGGATIINTNGGKDVFVGTDSGFGNRFAGMIDDLRIYDHALSASEVSALASMGGSGAPEPAETFAFLGLLVAAGLGYREWRSRRKAKAT
tara:strand:- start:120 stop:956 length:837 start_codon:yes stop_codon:yes gene_type:complete